MMEGDVSAGLSEEVCRRCHEEAGAEWTPDDDVRWAREMYVLCPHNGAECPYLAEHVMKKQGSIRRATSFVARALSGSRGDDMADAMALALGGVINSMGLPKHLFEEK